MKTRAAFRSFACMLFALILVTKSYSQQPSVIWRGLIIITDSIEHQWPGHNWYADQLQVALGVANGIYAASGMDSTQFAIAGVIRDQTHYGVKTAEAQVGDLYDSTGDLRRYISLRKQYAADIIILWNKSTNFAGGMTHYGPPLVKPPYTSWGGIWTNTYGGDVYVHEAGHIHGLGHCQGYRRSFDSLGNYVTTGITLANGFHHGFHTVMAYVKTTPKDTDGYTNCTDFGDPNDSTQATLTLADSTLPPRWNDSTHRYEKLGAVGHNDAPLYKSRSATIRALVNTPANLTIADSMDLNENDYADFMSIGGITLEPGFNFTNAKMNISVGSGVMAKRGINISEQYFLDSSITPKTIGAVTNFTIGYDAGSKSLKISFNKAAGANVSVAIFDLKGEMKYEFGADQVISNTFSKAYRLNELSNGTYFVQVGVGKQNIYKRFTNR